MLTFKAFKILSAAGRPGDITPFSQLHIEVWDMPVIWDSLL
jgi:hypothetical protein